MSQLRRIFAAFAFVSLLVLTVGPILAQSETAMTYDQALACVKKVLPSSMYATNDYLPTADTLADIKTPSTITSIKVGMPWVLNTEESEFYNAIEEGYYAAEGLDVTLVEGGPGVDHMPLLAAGQDDFAVAAGGGSIPLGWASPTPLHVVAIGTTNQLGQYAYITTDPNLIGKELTPSDLVGATVYTQQGGDVYTNILLDQYGIPRDSVKIDPTAGFGPDSIMLNGAAGVEKAFYTAWLTNQPYALDQAGIKWNAMRYGDFSYTEYTDVIVARPDTLSTPEGQDLARRFMRATYRGLQFMLSNPEKSADYAVKYGAGMGVTREEALWRFDLQDKLNIITGPKEANTPLMSMDPDAWDIAVATLLQYGQLQLDCPS